jgi:preprotein translocase subunit SecG
MLTVILGFVFVVLCAFLILLVLMQPSKSGGMGGLGGGAASGAITESLGASHAEKSLARWTSWGMAGFFVLALLLTLVSNRTGRSELNLGGEEPAPALVPGNPPPVTPAE